MFWIRLSIETRSPKHEASNAMAEVVPTRMHKSDEKLDEVCDSDDERPIGTLFRALPRHARGGDVDPPRQTGVSETGIFVVES